jgi:hypothetical protein
MEEEILGESKGSN